MQPLSNAHSFLQRPRAIALVAGLHLFVVRPASAALEAAVYQTVPGATVEERGDGVSGGSRVMPITATFTFDLSHTQPSLTAVIPNALLEGDPPFPLTVRSSSGARLSDGSYWFSGDYLGDLYPTGTQYIFDWRFSPSTNGRATWNGYITWAGGHLWDVSISNLTLVPLPPRLDITRADSQLVVSWSTNYPGYQLEQTASLSAIAWSEVTNHVAIVGDRFSIAIIPETGSAHLFFRLSNPKP